MKSKDVLIKLKLNQISNKLKCQGFVSQTKLLNLKGVLEILTILKS